MAQPVQIRNYAPACFFEFTRPANTTTYASGDIVTSTATAANVTPLKFPASPDKNGCGYIVGARLIKGSTVVASADFRLWLFVSEPFVAAGYPADNDALGLTETSLKNAIGFFDFAAGNWVTATSSAYCANTNANGLSFSLDKVAPQESADQYQGWDRTRLIYGVLEARGAYAPASGETFRVQIDVSATPGGGRSSGNQSVAPSATSQWEFPGSVVASELTRPSDGNAYAVGDAIANSTSAGSVVPLQFSVGRVVGFTGRIIGAKIVTDQTTTGAMRLHLFNTTPFAAAGFQADNAALLLTYTALTTGSAGTAPHYIGYIDFETFKSESTSAHSIGQALQTELVFDCAAGSQIIFGLLEARAIFTPTTGQKFTVVLDVVQG